MHYDSPYNTKKRREDVDFFDRETEVQVRTPVAYDPPRIGRATLWFPRHLAGYDEAELEARALASYAYDWRRR